MRELRLVLLGLAALLALSLGGTFLMRAFTGPPTAHRAVEPAPSTQVANPTDQASSPDATSAANLSTAVREVRASVERSIADAPDYTRFFDRLKLVFPSEYESIMNGIANANLQRRDVSSDIVMSDAVAALRRARGSLAARASEDALAQIFTIQRQEVGELEARDPHLCVAFLYGANGTGFLSFAAEHRALVTDAAIASLDAMNSGRMDNVQRGPPSDADFQVLDQALVDKGLARPEIDSLLDGKTASPPIADDRMCKAGGIYLDTLSGLPSDIRARLYGLAVDLMAKS